MQLTLVRHGLTDWNAAKRFQGHSDVGLNAEGRAQAHALSTSLALEHFDAIAASDLVRCRETAEIICASRKESVLLDTRWREFHFGVWEGLTWNEIVERGLDDGTPENGESFADVRARVHEAFRTLRERNYQDILIITHAGPIQALLSLLVPDIDALGMRIELGSITRIVQYRVNERDTFGLGN